MKKVTIHSPASVGNLVCGFDILGMALHAPYDIMELSLLEEPVVRIRHEDGFGLPEDPEKNVAGVVLLSIQKAMNSPVGFSLRIDKKIKPGSGIGSSSASAAGAAVAANALLGNRFTPTELVQFAMDGEQLASGSRHADNIAPCILGGVALVRSHDPLDIVHIPSPDFFVTVLHPQIEVRTEDARRLLKQEVPLRDAIRQWGNVAGLVAGLMHGDYGLVSRSLEDVVAEPARSGLIPAFYEVKQLSMESGALGGGISGSGPSMFMLSRDRETALRVEAAMKTVYDRTGIAYYSYVTNTNMTGVMIVDSGE